MYQILTDTSANLSTSYLREHDVALVPLSYLIDGKVYTCEDQDSFDGDAFFQAMRDGVVVTTSQINPDLYRERMEPILQAGRDILFVGMSSGISGSFASACVAASMLLETYPQREIRLIDTLCASLGEGMVVFKAVELRDQGVSLAEAERELNHYCRCIMQVFTVDDLMFLNRGGRLSTASALMGTVLNIKPILKGNEKGQIVSSAKVRGRKKSIDALAERYGALVKDAASQTVCIAHGGAREDALRLRDLIQKINPPKEILVADYEPVTGSHVGPGVIALFFLGGEDVRLK